MPRQLFLGIDIGTQSTRVALVDPSGQVIASHNRGYDLVVPRPGWAEQDPETWWQAALEGIHAVLKTASVQPGEVLAVGCDAQMHATIPIGPSGELLSHGVQLWCDKRGSGLADALQDHSFLPAACRLAGNPPVAAWWGFKIKWLKTYESDLYARAWKFLTGEGFINYRLTGELSIDWTEASGAFLLDAEKLDWSPALADFLEIDPAKLPPVFKSTDLVGTIHSEAALLTGLPEGTPVVAGAGDMLATMVATGLIENGRAMDTTGTSSDLVFFVDKPLLDPPMMNLHHTLSGWSPFGIVETSGGSLRWFRDQLAQAEVQQAARQGVNTYDLLNARAAQAEPGSGGLIYLPYLGGERVLGTPNARGAFIGLTLRTDLGAMVRAIQEGVSFELRRTLEIVENAGNQVNEVYFTGGGARSPVWAQIKADIYKKPVYTLAAEEGGVLGSAILAMLGLGFYNDVHAATARCVRVDRLYKPNPGNFARYDALFEIFKDIHDRLQSPFDRIAKVI